MVVQKRSVNLGISLHIFPRNSEFVEDTLPLLQNREMVLNKGEDVQDDLAKVARCQQLLMAPF